MRYGLIGTGYWARQVHARALTAGPDTTLVGVWGRDTAKAAALAECCDAIVYRDPNTMFADVDAVAFAVPPHVQAPLAIEAAAAGCHLLLEKPLALDVGAARAVAESVTANEVASVVFFKLRFVPAVVTWIDDARARGGWWGARSTMLLSLMQPDSPFAGASWRREHGGLWDIGPHALSMILAVLGPVTGVAGVRGPRDSVQLALRHARGGASSVLVSLDAPPAAKCSELTVFGEHGWDQAPDDRGIQPVQLFQNAAAALEAAARGDAAHPCDARFGLEVVEVLARAQEQLG